MTTNRLTPHLALGVVVLVAALAWPDESTASEPAYATHGFPARGGRESLSPLVLGPDGLYYGTHPVGGVGNGTIFRLEADGAITTVHVFADSDGEGCSPAGALHVDADGKIYGTTIGCGSSVGGGTAWRVAPGGQFHVLHTFGKIKDNGMDVPCGGLVEGPDGMLYGILKDDHGAPGGRYGGIFRMDHQGQVEILRKFTTAQDPHYPTGAPVFDASGVLWGTSMNGGPQDAGSVWALGADGGLRVHFLNRDLVGAKPIGALLLGQDGAIYGTTSEGGPRGGGSVFRLGVDGELQVLHAFDAAPSDPAGHQVTGGVSQGADGTLYGSSQAGGAGGWGTVWALGVDGGLSVLHAFQGGTVDGAAPAVAPTVAADGLRLLGTTMQGGPRDMGVAYTIAPQR